MCTGNICRSPMAEALLADRLDRLGVDARVSSAGLLFDGRAAEPEAVDAMADLGLDISAHRSRRLTPELAAHADVVIGMELRHIREACVSAGSPLDHTYTLPELVGRGEATGPRSGDLDRWLARVGEGRTPSMLMRSRPELEVADPMGGSARAFRSCAAELTQLTDRLVSVLFPVAARDRTAPATPAGSSRGGAQGGRP